MGTSYLKKTRAAPVALTLVHIGALWGRIRPGSRATRFRLREGAPRLLRAASGFVRRRTHSGFLGGLVGAGDGHRPTIVCFARGDSVDISRRSTLQVGQDVGERPLQVPSFGRMPRGRLRDKAPPLESVDPQHPAKVEQVQADLERRIDAVSVEAIVVSRSRGVPEM